MATAVPGCVGIIELLPRSRRRLSLGHSIRPSARGVCAGFAVFSPTVVFDCMSSAVFRCSIHGARPELPSDRRAGPERRAVFQVQECIDKRDQRAFTVQASTELQVAGPTRLAMIGTSTYVDVSGPIAAGKSKREKANVSLSSTTTRVSLWLKHVTFKGGRNWDNTDPSQCVFAPPSGGGVVRTGPV